MKEKLLALLQALVSINSISSTLSDGPGEAALAGYVHRRLSRIGLDPQIQAVAENRDNVVGLIEGTAGGPSFLLNAHLDTVGANGMTSPFDLKQEGDRLYGLGAYDMKGSIAIMLLLAEFFKGHPPPVDIWLTFVADEEDKSTGMAYLVDRWLPHLDRLPVAAVFLEPTEEQIGIAHKGFSWFEIEIAGKAAHGSRPEQGIDAILPLRAALSELEAINTELGAASADPLLGHASLHGGVIEGGTALSVIPARSRLRWERRTLPGETTEDISRELDRVLQAVDTLPGGHRVTGKTIFTRPSYKIEESSELVNRLKAATPRSQCIGLSFWADSALGGMAGIPSVLYGPAGHGAHATDEWVSLASLVRVYDAIKRLIKDWS